MDKINLSVIWAAIAATASVMLWMFSNIAWSEDVNEKILHVEQKIANQNEKIAEQNEKIIEQKSQTELNMAYGQYYDRLDDYEESLAEGRQALADEYERQMERAKAIICKHEPTWERCRETQ